MRQPHKTLLAAASLLLFGCGNLDDLGEGAEQDPVEAASSPLVHPCEFPAGSSCVDHTVGALTVRIKACPRSGSVTGYQRTRCSAEPDFVVVGGGGNVVGSPSPGALMTGSYYSASGGDAWVAEFKTHHSSNSYQMQAYMIGLKVAGLTAAQLKSYLKIVETKSARSTNPSVQAALPAGYKLIGGGGYLALYGAGMLLTKSQPASNAWAVAGKAHIDAGDGYAIAQAIGIPDCIGNTCFNIALNSVQSASVSTGYATAAMASNSGRVLSSIGGWATDDGVGRFLTHMVPFDNGATSGALGVYARSKDRSLVSAGLVRGYVVTMGSKVQ
jgi:hypothetical protein